MNCKPGDLAVIVGGNIAENVGKFVTVLRAASHPMFFSATEHFWEIEFSGTCVNFFGELITGVGIIDDKNLRPIRDNDGQDESLAWAGKPQQINSPELVK